MEMTLCRNCNQPTFGDLCTPCWDRVVAGELTLNMGPYTKQEAAQAMIARIPAIRKIDRILAEAGR